METLLAESRKRMHTLDPQLPLLGLATLRETARRAMHVDPMAALHRE